MKAILARRLLAALSLVVLAPGPLAGAPQAGWIPLGPEAGQRVRSLAILPGEPPTVVVGASSGVFRTGAAPRWDLLNGVDLPTHVTGHVHASGSRLYVATPVPDRVEGVFRSDDGGTSWTRVKETSGLLATSPLDASRLYLATRGGLETSRDGGDTWEPAVSYPRPDLAQLSSLGAVAAAPSAPDTVYVVLDLATVTQLPFELLVLRSDDGGATWTAEEEVELADRGVEGLLIHPEDPSILYLFGPGGVFRSTDGGRTWEKRHEGLPSFGVGGDPRFSLATLTIDPRHPDTLYAGIRARPTNGVAGGVYRSVDSGATWEPVLEGLPLPTTVHALVPDPSGSGGLYAGTPTGVFHASDPAGPWRRASGLLPTPVTAVAVDPREPFTTFAGADQRRLFVSEDGGDRWRPSGDGLPMPRFDSLRNRIEVLAVSPTDPSILFLHPFSSGVSGRSLDGGETWHSVPTSAFGTVQEILIDPREPTRVLATSDRVGGVSVSDDLGESWELLLAGSIESLAQAPSDPDVIYAGSKVQSVTEGHAEGVCRSGDGGGSWECSTSGLAAGSRITALAVSPLDPSVVLAAGAGGGSPSVVKSLDGGETWEATGSDLPAAAFVTDLVFDPRDPRLVWAATLRADGVYRSTDEGASWAPVSRGLTHPDVWDLTFDPGGRVLLAATEGGLFRYSTAAGPAPPDEIGWLTDPGVPGFRFKVRIDRGGGQALPGTREGACIAETACVSGAVPGRSELFVRIVGPKPNGLLWPTLVKFSTSRIEVWIQQLSTGELRYYDLRGASPGFDELPGLFDRTGFVPE